LLTTCLISEEPYAQAERSGASVKEGAGAGEEGDGETGQWCIRHE